MAPAVLDSGVGLVDLAEQSWIVEQSSEFFHHGDFQESGVRSTFEGTIVGIVEDGREVSHKSWDRSLPIHMSEVSGTVERGTEVL